MKWTPESSFDGVVAIADQSVSEKGASTEISTGNSCRKCTGGSPLESVIVVAIYRLNRVASSSLSEIKDNGDSIESVQMVNV